MERKKYIVEAETELKDQKFCERRTHDPTKDFILELHTLIRVLRPKYTEAFC